MQSLFNATYHQVCQTSQQRTGNRYVYSLTLVTVVLLYGHVTGTHSQIFYCMLEGISDMEIHYHSHVGGFHLQDEGMTATRP